MIDMANITAAFAQEKFHHFQENRIVQSYQKQVYNIKLGDAHQGIVFIFYNIIMILFRLLSNQNDKLL